MTAHLLKSCRWWLPLLAMLLLLTGGCSGTDTMLRERRVQADAIIARWVDATGGASRIREVKCVTTDVMVRFRPDLPEMPLRVTETTRGRFRWELGTPAFGPIVTVSDGLHALRWNDKLGAGLVTSAEFAELRRESSPDFALSVAEDFPMRIRMPDTTVDGTTLQVVDLRDHAGNHEVWSFDPMTGLRLRRQRGPDTTVFSDHRTVDGITTPFAAVNQPSGIVSRVTKITMEPSADPKLFELSPDQLAEAGRIDGMLERYYQASGGAALDLVFSRRSTLITDIPAQKLRIETVTTQKRPMKILTEQNIPGMGRFCQGYDGKTAWASSDLQGYRELQGQELVQLLNTADLGAEARLRETSPFRRMVGEKELPSGPAVGLALAGYGGPSGVYWFDQASGRIVQIESNIITGPESHFQMTMTMDDFREVDGVWIPFVTRVDNPTLKMTTTITKVENNVAVDDTVFAPRQND